MSTNTIERACPSSLTGSAVFTHGKPEPYTLIRCTCVGPTITFHEESCMASVAFRLCGFELVGYYEGKWYGYREE